MSHAAQDDVPLLYQALRERSHSRSRSVSRSKSPQLLRDWRNYSNLSTHHQRGHLSVGDGLGLPGNQFISPEDFYRKYEPWLHQNEGSPLRFQGDSPTQGLLPPNHIGFDAQTLSSGLAMGSFLARPSAKVDKLHY